MKQTDIFDFLDIEETPAAVVPIQQPAAVKVKMKLTPIAKPLPRQMAEYPDMPDQAERYPELCEARAEFFEKSPTSPFVWYWLRIKGKEPGDMISWTEAQHWLEREVEELKPLLGMRIDDLTLSVENFKEKLEAHIAEKWREKL